MGNKIDTSNYQNNDNFQALDQKTYNYPRTTDEYDENGVPRSEYYHTPVSIETIKQKANTGDIFLFCGNSEFSKLIKGATQSYWTHVAVAIRRENGDLMVLQSIRETKDKKFYMDYLTGKYKNTGVMLNRIEDVWEEDKGKIYYRKLIIQNHVISKQLVDNFLESVKDLPYEENLFILVFSAWRLNNTEDFSSQFCSELVYRFYYNTGLLEDRQNPNNSLPLDYSESGQNSYVHFKSFVKLNIMYRISGK